MSDIIDISDTLKAKSDQLNADDLVGGPIRVQIEDVRLTQGDDTGPVTVRISGGHMPWKPCKTMRRVLASAWGTNAAVWRGRWVELYCDPKVKFGGKEVGGIRIARMSHIDGERVLNLAVTKDKKQAYRISVLKPEECAASGASTANLDDFLDENGLTREQLDTYLTDAGKTPLAERTPEALAKLAAAMASNPDAIDAVRAVRVPGEEG